MVESDLTIHDLPPRSIKIASRTKRFLAYLIDIVPIILVVILFKWKTSNLEEVYMDYINKAPNAMENLNAHQSVISLTSFLIWIAFCIHMEASEYRGTWGKILMGIEVVDSTGQPLDQMTSIKRNVSKILSHLPFNIGFINILFHPKRQGWHDLLAKTLVIEKETWSDKSK